MTHRWSEARKERMHEYLARHYVVRHSDRDLCVRWAEITSAMRRKGLVIDTADAWIAATALALDAPLVTHNPADFMAVERLKILSALR